MNVESQAYQFSSLPIASDYDIIIVFCVDSASFATSFKKCNIIMT